MWSNQPRSGGTAGRLPLCGAARVLVQHEEFFLDEAAKAPGKKYVAHNNQTITQLEEKKKALRREAFGAGGSEEKRKEFYLCLQAISELKQIEKRKQELKNDCLP